MLLVYEDAVNEYGSLYKVKKAVSEGKLFKVSPGIYSRKAEVSDIERIMVSCRYAVFTMDSAFYFLGLTDVIPEQMHIAIGRHMTRPKEAGVKVYFESPNYSGVGKTEMVFNGSYIRCYDRERMLLELVRHRKKMAFDYYKEIVQSYRRLKDEIDFAKLDDYIDAMKSRTDFYEIMQREIF